jgi:oligopeptide/dipeptide ABC transporter ATP-binding protein
VSAPLLAVTDLETRFESERGPVRAVDGVSFEVARGEVVGLVGESGCGKTATALSLLGLLPKPAGRIASGSVRLDGRELVGLPEAELRRIRGNRIAMIFQDPMTSLNPYLRVREQLVEVAELHLGLSRRAARERAVALLGRVGIADPAARIEAYPHELSGGMRQRVMIAMALLCDPDLLVADEPTTALDVTIQGQILALLRELQAERGLAILLITHDLGVVAGLTDRVLVMYAGVVVEEAGTGELFAAPGHPYTEALLASLPRIGAGPRRRLSPIAGMPPRLDQGAFGACRFAPRCPHVVDACRAGEPPLHCEAGGRARRCILPRGRVQP